MEDAFSLLFVSKDFPEIYRSGRGPHHPAGTRREIQDFLRLVIGMLATISKQATQTLYDKLAGALQDGDTIITLNYDTLLDSALAQAGWNPQIGYGMSGGASKFKWKPPKALLNARYQQVKLLKLHGSLNWFARGSYTKLSRVFDSKPTRITNPDRTNEIKGFIRQIVPPVYGKFFAHKHWREIWTRAYRDLLQAEMIVVVGCSLVDTDFHLRALFGRVVAKRRAANQSIAYGIFVDRTRVRRKWQRLFGSLVRCRKDFGTFQKFMTASGR
ncbi:MAG: SIR2 family protein [Candidatus Binataceae bacterium]